MRICNHQLSTSQSDGDIHRMVFHSCPFTNCCLCKCPWSLEHPGLFGWNSSSWSMLGFNLTSCQETRRLPAISTSFNHTSNYYIPKTTKYSQTMSNNYVCIFKTWISSRVEFGETNANQATNYIDASENETEIKHDHITLAWATSAGRTPCPKGTQPPQKVFSLGRKTFKVSDHWGV